MIHIVLLIILRLYILYCVVKFFILLSKKIFLTILNKIEKNDIKIIEKLSPNAQSSKIDDTISENNISIIQDKTDNKKLICLHLYVPDDIMEEDIKITKDGNISIKDNLYLEVHTYKKKAIVLLCTEINSYLFDKYNKFTEYDIYLILSTNIIKKYNKNNYKNIFLISIEEEKFNNFNKTNDIMMNKVLYYFSNIKTNYKYMWIVEYNTYVDSEKVFFNIDNKYKNSDLLCQSNNIIKKPLDVSERDAQYNTYVCKSNVQCIRISNKLLDCIKIYMKDNKESFSKESFPKNYLFNTIAFKNNCIIDIPEEFSTIQPNMIWNNSMIIDINNIYYPYKYSNINE